MSSFTDSTAVVATGPTSYSVEIDPGWSIGPMPNGGYLLAVLTRAALHATGRDDPLAVSGHFLRPPALEPATLEVDVLKSGRQTSAARVSLWQRDRLALDSLVTCGTLPERGAAAPTDWADKPMPAMPPPQDCLADVPGMPDIALRRQVEQRMDPATAPFAVGADGRGGQSPKGAPLLRGWMRLADGTDADPVFLTTAVDSMPPTMFNLGHYGWAPTVELTALIRARPAPGWLAFESRTRLSVGGWFDEDATIWDSTGQVVAQSRQLAIAPAGSGG